ncbi:asparagine synthase (glutamine-hydrolyzing) [Psychrobacter sp. DAB_AL62B]|uniref:asparagine synthase (glutamine-hydrolyzing) n=1 Tax=Psychrobacter sp. DAB_AL62B TaxID=1028420 RepID=UPI0023810B6F|nr:asparagine synthase (glutamine-hydrolyzing) [Psychrobacter sp. DAB_AL62B]MDE4455114.1 asparagine synthase (glutamine-hydrolyzing) [Psychrobacter sp. DAB_AL62B]
MCGLLGVVDYKKNINTSLFKEMLDSLKHRGPDDEGLEVFSLDSCSIFLGHRRLSIIDISSNGHQPMLYEHLAIIYNGEVYNFKDIRQELILNGYSFDSNTDTEVILKSYHLWGTHCVDKFRGMFAFAIYNAKQQEIKIFRDRAGVKPLYYSLTDDALIFSSELKPLLNYPDFNKDIDFEAVSSYLQFGYIHAPKTIFKNVQKLLPGHYLKYDIASKNLVKECYWNINDFYENQVATDNVVDELESIITEAFNLRMIADVPVGVFLSGGIDSSLVAAIVQKNSKIPINTFTIGFEDKRFDESNYAKDIAEYLGTNHTELICKKEDVLATIKKLSKIFDEPFADSSAIPTVLVSELAKKQVSVVLSGDGGDELFCGYPSYALMEKRFQLLSKVPFRKKLKKLSNVLPVPTFMQNKVNKKLYKKFIKFKNMLDHDDIVNSFKVTNSVFSKDEIKNLIQADYYFSKDTPATTSNLEKMMISDFKGYLPDDLMVKIDRSTMSASLEGREPLLDNKIIEFAASLPISYKKDKEILKNILGRYIPKDLFLRKKQGFGIPINYWLREDLKYLLDQYLSEDLIKEYNIFNYNYVSKLLELFYAEKNDDNKVWVLLMFQMWFSENIDSNKCSR